MAASPQLRESVPGHARLGSSPPPPAFFHGTNATFSADEDAGIVAKAVERALPRTSLGGESRNYAPGIPDRRKSTRPSSSGSTRSGRGGRRVGSNVSIKLNGEDSPGLGSPGGTEPWEEALSTMSPRTGMISIDEDATPGETSASEFEDAVERPETPTSNSTPEKSQHVGLGINGNGLTATPERPRNGGEEDTTAQTTSRHLETEPIFFDQDAPSDMAVDLAAEVGSRSATPEVEGAHGLPDEQTPTPASRPSHVRQDTSEAAPAPVTGEDEQETESAISLVDMRSRLQSHSRQATAETVPSLQPPEQGAERSISPSKRMSRQSVRFSQTTLEPLYALSGASAERSTSASKRLSAQLSPDSNPSSRSISPAKLPVRPQSPTQNVQGLSGDVSVSHTPPPSTSERIRALEERGIGEHSPRASLPPQPGGLAKTASTRIAGFLGRMGSVRKPARSPTGPRPDRLTAERRTSSIASVTTANGDNLTATAEEPDDAASSHSARRSLQDQFQTLRKQSEHTGGLDGHAMNGDEEKSTDARTGTDADLEAPRSPDRASLESKKSRMRSPTLDPSLPPGTASGITAGPADEPRPVDWDLWQAVVNEGPSAVARTSGEELNRAIASGIPAAIRGVVWQVLADSKSPELEDVYRILKARGTTDAEQPQLPLRPMPSPSRTEPPINMSAIAERPEKDSGVSSPQSSVRSGNSTPATSTMASQASPPPSLQGDGADLTAKLAAEKAKREAAAMAKLEKAIKKDLGSRTSFSKYTQAAGLQDGLFGICKAYALFDEGVGYAQGINFIAMPLLFNMAEEEAFTLLVRLMSKYDVRSLFVEDMSGLQLRLYQFERLLEDHDPALYSHLRRRNVGPQLYATQWFLTLFAYRFPLQLVLRVYDLIFSDGLTAILKFGLVLVQRNREALLEMKDLVRLTDFLKEKLFDVYIDKSPSASSLLDSGFFGSVTGGADKELYRADEMVRDACQIKISDADLAEYAAEWEEAQRRTKEQAAELENLRATNATLTVRAKALEDRTQQQDTEHVSIAGDVVRVKVKNDELLDENEGLKVKIEELQKMVVAQPAEVEEKLKEEMNRILQRNSEVQNENRALKEEQEEMEKELISVKVKHAQTQEDFEALVKKWANLQAMISDK